MVVNIIYVCIYKLCISPALQCANYLPIACCNNIQLQFTVCLFLLFRWAEMQENSITMVSYSENIVQTGNSIPDQAVFEADKRAVYK